VNAYVLTCALHDCLESKAKEKGKANENEY
jgi:hypothetical protein